MDKIVDRFIGLDPILGDQAKDELIAHGEKSLDLVIDRFGRMTRTPHLQMRLGQLFGHFGDSSLDRLLNTLRSKDWHKMVDATYCFSNLSREPAGSELVKNLSRGGNFDLSRCSIDALGYLGASRWNYKINELFTSKEDYTWEKLSYNAFAAFFRLAVKETDQNGISNSLLHIENFFKFAGNEKIQQLLSRGFWYDLEIILSDFKAIAADSIIKHWLNKDNPVLKRLAAKALGWMRLNRTVNVLTKQSSFFAGDDETVREIAHALAQLQIKEAAKAIRQIYSMYNSASPHYDSICLHMATCLDKLDDRDFVNEIYPGLLNMRSDIVAHTYYNLGLLGFGEEVWSNAINSEDYIIRASIAPLYARLKGEAGLSKLLQMERESSYDIERILILSSLINAGYIEKQTELHEALVAITKTTHLRMLRYIWKREIIIALRNEGSRALSIWEKLFGVDANLALEELHLSSSKDDFHIKQLPRQELTPLIPKKPIRIFISYAHEDEKIRKLLVETHLKAIKNNYDETLEISTDSSIKPGSNWDNKIKKSIGEADIVLFLITSSFLASDYIKRTEIKNAMQRYNEKKQIIVPLYIEGVAKKLLPFRDKQYLPSSKPLKKYTDKSDAWILVQEGIIKLIDDIKTGKTLEYFE
jgi:hypothetical protein